MKQLTNPILLAKIGAPHGVQGQLRVTSYSDNPLGLGDYGPLLTKEGQLLSVSKVRASKNVLVVSFKEIKSREDAEKVRGLELFIERDQLPEDTDEDEFYSDDLIGMLVVDGDQKIIGKICAVPNFGAGDLLEISPAIESGRFGSNTWFLEFTKMNVPQLDFENGRVTVVLPDEINERHGERDGDEDDG